MDGDQHAGNAAPRRRWRLGRTLVGVVAVLLPALAVGVSTARADASVGPHLARYEMTVDHQVTLDLGPLGTLVVDSPLPLSLGLRVEVAEIPWEVTAVEPADTLTALAGDLQAYVQFFGSPESTLEVAARELVLDAARRTAVAAVLLGGSVLVVRAVLGPVRRAELAGLIRRDHLVVAGLLAVVVGAVLTSSGPSVPETDDERVVSAVFDGTPLAGARITGRLAGVIDTYGGLVVDAYRANEDFYDAAVLGVRSAWAERVEIDARLAAGGDLLGWIGPPTTSTGPFEPGSAATATDPAAATDAAAEPVVLLVVSDLHCNVGMARVIREVATLAGADVVLNAGDTTVNGTAVESSCVSAFADAVPAGATMVVSDGNHDSTETSAQEAAAGVHVLDGEVVEVAGLRILGDSDPNATRIGVGTRPAGQESLGETATRLAEVACTDGRVDLLLVHTPSVGALALERGCVPAQVSGHTHRRAGPTVVGGGVRFVSASTAGAKLDQATVGPLSGTAELTVLRFDPQRREILDHRLVLVQPDASARVGSAVPWPVVTED